QVVIPRMVLHVSGVSSRLSVSALDSGDGDLRALEQAIDGADRLAGGSSELETRQPDLETQQVAPDFPRWRAMIESALEEVERGELIKVVLARRQMLEFAADVNVPGVLHRLRSIFPSTAVFAVGGDSGDFVGASPERLVRAETGSFD